MYWYNLKVFTGIVLACGSLFMLSACRPQVQSGNFFDMKGYFDKEAGRLNALNPKVEKTTYHNDATETKTVQIKDWKRELGMFSDADINKPSWKSSYDVTDEDSLLVYRAKDKNLLVQHLDIKRTGQKVRWILIYTKVKNLLYSTTKKLTYYPDSLYSIEMTQHVKLGGQNTYKVQGRILKAGY